MLRIYLDLQFISMATFICNPFRLVRAIWSRMQPPFDLVQLLLLSKRPESFQVVSSLSLTALYSDADIACETTEMAKN
jgi:hypothetical protein